MSDIEKFEEEVVEINDKIVVYRTKIAEYESIINGPAHEQDPIRLADARLYLGTHKEVLAALIDRNDDLQGRLGTLRMMAAQVDSMDADAMRINNAIADGNDRAARIGAVIAKVSQ